MRKATVFIALCVCLTLAACAPAAEPSGGDSGSSTRSTASHPVDELTVDGTYVDTHPEPYSWARDHSLIAHGFGGLGEYRVTNCFEAFEANYRAGHRVFEVDLVFTSDGALVARHDWEEYMYAFLGQNVEDPAHVMSLEEFEALPIHGTNRPMTIENIVQLMRAYPDIWIVTDTKSAEEADVLAAMQEIVDAVGDDEVLLERFIVQVYDEPMLGYVREVHEFDNIIYTLYQITGTKEAAAAFAAANGIGAVTFPETMWSAEYVALLDSQGLIAAVHTVNDEQQVQAYQDSGVDVIYTDFLTP